MWIVVRKHLDADPACIRIRVSEEFFPMVNPKAGGKIYQWTLGYRASPYQAAAKSRPCRCAAACSWSAVLRRQNDRGLLAARRRDTVASLKSQRPEIAQNLSEADRD